LVLLVQLTLVQVVVELVVLLRLEVLEVQVS
jgi:hypothetical protein